MFREKSELCFFHYRAGLCPNRRATLTNHLYLAQVYSLFKPVACLPIWISAWGGTGVADHGAEAIDKMVQPV